MTETVSRQQTPAETELALRQARAELPGKIAAASSLVQDLRGDGHREGDPELEAALQTVRDLSGRERALPDKILDAVAERCEAEAAALRERERALVSEHEALRREVAEAQREFQAAKRKAETARTRAEAIEIQRDGLRMEAIPFEDFARAARAAEGEKRLRLLEDARANGLLLPLNLNEDSDL